jgi:glutathione S-transferase
MYTLYSMRRSGNSYKVRLALARLGIPYKLVEVDILKGESRTPEFLAKNPNGQVPLLEVAPDRHLAESNAILWYVAGGSTLAPEDRITRAEALQWMFFEQHSLEPNIGAAYFWLALIKGGRELQSHALEDWMENGYRALGVMETHLTRHRFFVADHFTIADIALYAYTHVADQCDFDLSRFPAIGAWLARVAEEPYPHDLQPGLPRNSRKCRLAYPCLETPRFVTVCPMGPNRCRVPALSGHHCPSESFQVRSCASTFSLQASRPRQVAPLAANAGLPSSPSLWPPSASLCAFWWPRPLSRSAWRGRMSRPMSSTTKAGSSLLRSCSAFCSSEWAASPPFRCRTPGTRRPIAKSCIPELRPMTHS